MQAMLEEVTYIHMYVCAELMQSLYFILMYLYGGLKLHAFHVG